MESAKESHCSPDHLSGKLSQFMEDLQKLQNFSCLTIVVKVIMCCVNSEYLRNHEHYNGVIYIVHTMKLIHASKFSYLYI